MPLGTEVNFGLCDVVLDGVAAPSPLKRAQPPSFRPISIVAKWLDASRCHVVWSPRDCVRWGPSLPPQKGGRAPQFAAHIYCGEMAGWIKMALGMEVNFGLCDVVLDGFAAPPP